MQNHNVFVYGSLKRGFGNNASFLGNSPFLGNGTTANDNFDMISLGAFPAVFRNLESSKNFFPAENIRNARVSGEVYQVSSYELNKLDALEGNGSFYTREEILIDVEDKGPILCWCYMIPGAGDMAFWSSRSHYETQQKRVIHNSENNVVSWSR